MRVCMVSVLIGSIVLLAPSAVLAEQPTGLALASADQELVKDRIDRLESLVQQQEQQIRDLRSQIHKTNASMDEARVAQIKGLVREVIADSEFRESLFPDQVQVGYDGGFYLRSADEQFLLKINGILQVRYAHYNDQLRNRWTLAPGTRRTYSDRSGFSIDSIHLLFSGHLYGPELTYMIHLITTEKPPGGDNSVAMQWYTWRAFADYKFADEFHIRAGLLVVPFGLQESYTSNAKTMFVTRGMANEYFNMDRSIGVQAWGELLDKKLKYQVAVTNGWRNARDRFNTPDVMRELDQNPAITARLEYAAIGEIGRACCESDLEYHEDPALALGLSLGYLDDNGDRSGVPLAYAVPDFFRDGVGGYNAVSTNGTNVTQFGADAHFKYRGLALTGEYWLRIVDVSNGNINSRLVAPYFRMTGDNDTSHQQGAQVQAGYFIVPKKLEAIARVGAVWDIGPGSEGSWEYAAGMNWYINGHANKLQFDVTKINELPTVSGGANFMDINDDILLWRLQWQILF